MPKKHDTIVLFSPSTDTRRKRKGTRKGVGTARVIKTIASNVNAPPARKRKSKTKSERGSLMERKEMSRFV